MNKILAINGSYRDDGITDQTIDALAQALKAAGAEVGIILLREYPRPKMKLLRVLWTLAS